VPAAGDRRDRADAAGHIDHSGYVPLLARQGFKGGRLLLAEATYELCRILLPDSGHLQEEEAEAANRRGYSKLSSRRCRSIPARMPSAA
jgi:Cft2 family RNA processing exonuclease